MKCVFCQKENIQEVFINYETNIDGNKYVVKNVPVLHCKTCEDDYYDNKVLKQIKEFLVIQSKINDSVKVFDYNVLNVMVG